MHIYAYVQLNKRVYYVFTQHFCFVSLCRYTCNTLCPHLTLIIKQADVDGRVNKRLRYFVHRVSASSVLTMTKIDLNWYNDNEQVCFILPLFSQPVTTIVTCFTMIYQSREASPVFAASISCNRCLP